MLPIKSVIKKTLLFLINVPEINMKVQHILRLVDEHKQTVIAALKNINYLKIIDYGCGEGFFSDCFNQSKYYGYDPNINKIIYAKKKFINYKFLSESPDFRMFDLFFFNNRNYSTIAFFFSVFRLILFCWFIV